MSSLSRDDVEAIAYLARLRLSEPEIERLRGELGAILEHMKALEGLDTDDVEPMTHAVPMDLRLRPDEVVESLPPEVALRQAPDREGTSFRVPNIIDKSGAK